MRTGESVSRNLSDSAGARKGSRVCRRAGQFLRSLSRCATPECAQCRLQVPSEGFVRLRRGARHGVRLVMSVDRESGRDCEP